MEKAIMTGYLLSGSFDKPLLSKKRFIEQIGEIGLIEKISKKFLVDKQIVPVGAGEDDCAVIDVDKAKGGHKYLVATTDTVQESTHFPAGISPFQIGWTSVAVNLSDIAAMGGHPFAFIVAMGIPAHTETAFVADVVEGIEKCASAYNTAVVGGDITKSKELSLTGTCLGFADKTVRRAGAKVGDLVCVTGSLGNAALGMKLIKKEIEAPKSVEEAAKMALFQPMPRVKEGIMLAYSGLVTSMIDISDGLALSLAELKKSSGVGFEIDEDKVPVLSEEIRSTGVFDRSMLGLRELAFFFGGDYELLFTVDASENEELLKMLKRKVKMSVIGKVVSAEEGIYFKTDEGKKEMMEIKGYRHF
ncbi:thiamine-phosphate kinase [Methanosarcinales archaeon]|nr:MAG: thiamine-phosphate kinase [Methanosarcinales archaeon]